MSRILILPMTGIFVCGLAFGLSARSLAEINLGSDAPERPKEHSNQDKGNPPGDNRDGHSNQDNLDDGDGGNQDFMLPGGSFAKDRLHSHDLLSGGFDECTLIPSTELWISDLRFRRTLKGLPAPSLPYIHLSHGDLFDFPGSESPVLPMGSVNTGAPIPTPGVLGLLGLGMLGLNGRRRRMAG